MAEADEGVWGRDGEVSLRRDGADEGEVSCSPLSALVLVLVLGFVAVVIAIIIEAWEEEDAKDDEAEDALWAW